jgi:hypothetical protein
MDQFTSGELILLSSILIAVAWKHLNGGNRLTGYRKKEEPR